VPLRGHRADPMGRRGGGGAARAPQASPQGEKAFAILKSFTALMDIVQQLQKNRGVVKLPEKNLL